MQITLILAQQWEEKDMQMEQRNNSWRKRTRSYTPSQPIDITPNYALGGQAQNINFNISAVDGASVQNMLNEQQGNIIAMIRQAANDNGEGFLESVDSDVYGGGG